MISSDMSSLDWLTDDGSLRLCLLVLLKVNIFGTHRLLHILVCPPLQTELSCRHKNLENGGARRPDSRRFP